MSSLLRGCFALTVAASSSAALGGIIGDGYLPLSQERGVSLSFPPQDVPFANGIGGPPPGTLEVVSQPGDFGPFSSSLDLTVSGEGGSGRLKAMHQSSGLTGNTITGSGDTLFDFTIMSPVAGFDEMQVGSRSFFFFSFEIDEATPFQLDWSVEITTAAGDPLQGGGSGFISVAAVQLFPSLGEKLGGASIAGGIIENPGMDGDSEAGVLAPGTYTLLAEAITIFTTEIVPQEGGQGDPIPNPPITAEYDFTFFIPTPGALTLVGIAGAFALRRRR